MTIKAATVGKALRAAEGRIALLERCQPLNFRVEVQRLRHAWRSGQASEPQFRYRSSANLSATRTQLAQLAPFDDGGPWGRVIAARAAEMDLEAQLVEAVGCPQFAGLARRRYLDDSGRWAAQAQSLVTRWLSEVSAAKPSEPLWRTDDKRNEQSLWCQLERLIAELKLPIRLELGANLVPVAATGDGVVLVAMDRQLSAAEGRRVALHEVVGHALPRMNAKRDPTGLLQVGTASASDDEEGRALLIEEQHGLLGSERRVALSFRHLAANAMFNGAHFADVVRSLTEQGCELDSAVSTAARIFRAGGLGREIVYLPAMLRVAACFEANPEAARRMEQGRIAANWISELENEPTPPEWLPDRSRYSNVAMTGQ
ncbi:MAG TPA: tyrosine/phenylalanine carboxypeptidase domain-containing protein [Polyangiaceae bacterium]|nr:tyrosine/phenylalanine carboxypeptidase domain-containing protein [Polyangiaceae bacterium]